jgi:CRISPR-associated protein (TIGR02584 family)
MTQPHTNTLLAITGLTPQVITETVYALAQEGSGSADGIPDRIEVITTTEGRRRIQLALFAEGGGQGYFDRLCADFGIDRDAIAFNEDSIHIIRDAAGEPLPDIVKEADNAAAADLINDRIRALTQAPETRLHVSLAGGRKTMGFYAGYALSLYGRAQDRLTHVLVNPPFESHPSFYYPPPTPVTVQLPGRNDLASTADAQVQLAEIPVVRLRHGLDQTLLEGELRFSEAVARAQQVLEPPMLTIDLAERSVHLQGQPTPLTDLEFLWLTWLAERAQRGEPAIPFDEAAGAELAAVLDRLEGTGASPLREGLESGLVELRSSGRTNYFDRTRSRLNKALSEKSALHPAAAARYQVHSFGKRPYTRYGLRLQPAEIRLVGEP